MAAGVVRISDVIVPSRFTSYVRQKTEEKSRLISSGVVVRDPALDGFLNVGGGILFNVPSWKDLDNDDENVSTDNPASPSSPKKIGTSQEVAVRLSRNQSWSSMDLASRLAGSDAMAAIGDGVAGYWARRAQKAFIATMQGVFADNAAAPTGTEHVLNDLTVDISNAAGAGVFEDGTTNFSAEALIDAVTTLGDSMDDIQVVFMHAIVYSRMLKNDLIDFIPDSQGRMTIPTFMGKLVIKDDGMPFSSGVYETWMFKPGAVRWGVGEPEVPTEIDREPSQGDGGGQDILYNRVEWSFHPVGHKFAVVSPASGGPSNAATAGNLAHADSWARVYPERKQIKVARLITREA